MLNAIRDSLSDLASSDDGEIGEDEDDDEEDPELSKMHQQKAKLVSETRPHTPT